MAPPTSPAGAAPPEPHFPFTAIVAQTAMKRALLLNAVNPRIGGVLVRGKKGTAKSTAVRSLAALLPEVRVVPGCPYNCEPEARQGLCQRCGPGTPEPAGVARPVPIVDLPVGATEDRLVGSLDIEQAIKTGERVFEPGLIAATHRGILYIDEVNLLNDHLVDVLLDAAAMGRNYVEREGVSVSHRAQFILVGTMNPEEGDLRPQLLDRFGLAVEVESSFRPEERREIVRRRIDYETAPYEFMARWQEPEALERQRLLQARQRLPQVQVGDEMLELITGICAEYEVDGLRGDIVMYKTASTIAAYENRTAVTAADVREAAYLALLHRQRRQPFQQADLATEQLDALIEEFQRQNHPREPHHSGSDGETETADADPPDAGDASNDGETPPEDAAPEIDTPEEQVFEVGAPFSVKPLAVPSPARHPSRAAGRRATAETGGSAGRYVRARPPEQHNAGLALDATLRAAAPHQAGRRAAAGRQVAGDADDDGVLLLESWDLREKVRESKAGSLVLFVVDASGSMGAQRRMVAVKGAVLSLLLDAYQRRDRVGLVAFRGGGAQTLLPPTGSVDLAQQQLQEMPTGGRTPLSAGLHRALEVVETERVKDRHLRPLLVLLSDGRANVTAAGVTGAAATAEAAQAGALVQQRKIPAVVVDTEDGYVRLGLAQPLAEAMQAHYLKLEDLQADGLAGSVRNYQLEMVN